MLKPLFLRPDSFMIWLQVYTDPSLINIDALKLSSGLKLDPTEIQQALRSTHSNPIKNWLSEIIFCYVKMICNHQAALLNQLLLNERKEQEYRAMLDELEQQDKEPKMLALPADLNLQAIAMALNNVIESKDSSSYQHLQCAKANELIFWSAIITDVDQLAIVSRAVDDRYHWLALGTEQIERTENEINDTALAPDTRARKEEKIQSYKDHLRLSSTEYLINIIPEIVHNPHQAVHIAQTRAIQEQMLVTSLSFGNKLTKPRQERPNVVFFDRPTQKRDKIESLRTKLDIVFNKYLEVNENYDHQLTNNLDHLLGLLTLHKRQSTPDLADTILLDVQNNINRLSFKNESKEIFNCLQSWLNPNKTDLSISQSSSEENKDEPSLRFKK